MTWQPIETAPREFIWVLLTGGLMDSDWDNYGDNPPAVVGQFICLCDDNDTEGYWQYTAFHSFEIRGEYYEPTHWMPLPEPPK
jgi:hypothetical protein